MEVLAKTGLFVGPWIGELGHEIMFVGLARAAAEHCEYVVACSRSSSAPLYADFASEFVPHGIECEGMIAVATRDSHVHPDTVARYVPAGMRRMAGREYVGHGSARWVRYGRACPQHEGAVVIHARSRPHVPERNWPQRNWNRLARRVRGRGVAERLTCIGLKKHALLVEGCRDMRDAPLDAQMDVLASAAFAIGPSSGPMHLASHCGCPHVVWCGGAKFEREKTRARYVSDWNPFDTPAHAHLYGSWQPSLETVWGWVAAFAATLAA